MLAGATKLAPLDGAVSETTGPVIVAIVDTVPRQLPCPVAITVFGPPVVQIWVLTKGCSLSGRSYGQMTLSPSPKSIPTAPHRFMLPVTVTVASSPAPTGDGVTVTPVTRPTRKSKTFTGAEVAACPEVVTARASRL